MGVIRNLLSRRFPKVSLLSDLALVGAAAGRVLQRRQSALPLAGSPVELALAGGAALRLVQRWRRRRKSKKLAA